MFQVKELGLKSAGDARRVCHKMTAVLEPSFCFNTWVVGKDKSASSHMTASPSSAAKRWWALGTQSVSKTPEHQVGSGIFLCITDFTYLYVGSSCSRPSLSSLAPCSWAATW